MKNKLQKMFNLKRMKFASKFVILFLFLVLIINIASITYSKYESNASLNANADIAYFIVGEESQSKTITLTGLMPSTDDFEYIINVKNADSDGDIADVDLKYTMSFTTTTNLPLEYELYRSSDNTTNLIDTGTLIQDTDVYYKKYTVPGERIFLHTSVSTDQYTLKIRFPVSYNTNSDAYQGKIELITITINAQQLV